MPTEGELRDSLNQFYVAHPERQTNSTPNPYMRSYKDNVDSSVVVESFGNPRVTPIEVDISMDPLPSIAGGGSADLAAYEFPKQNRGQFTAAIGTVEVGTGVGFKGINYSAGAYFSTMSYKYYFSDTGYVELGINVGFGKSVQSNSSGMEYSSAAFLGPSFAFAWDS